MSRYSNRPQYPNIDGKVVFFSAPALPPTFFNNFQRTAYFVNAKDRLDTIAAEYYDGRGEFWWIIAAANGLELPTDIYPGKFLTIPLDYKSVLAAVGQLNKVVI